MAIVSISELKKSSKNSVEVLKKQIQALNNQNSFQNNDERFWYPDVDKAGNGYAVIRFLPAAKGEETPYIQMFKHSFKGPTGLWYIENSLTTVGKPDPVAEMNSLLWNSGIEENKEIARARKRKLEYVCNVYIIKDPTNPANEGTVRLFRFGKKIFDKMNDLMNPKFPDEKPINPYDFWEGANFKMKIVTKDKYRNYDSSAFDAPSALFDDDAKIEAIWNKQHPLQPLVAADQFKDYDHLKEKLNKVLGKAETVAPKNEEAPKQSRPVQQSKPSSAEDDDEDGDSEVDANFFKKLAESE